VMAPVHQRPGSSPHLAPLATGRKRIGCPVAVVASCDAPGIFGRKPVFVGGGTKKNARARHVLVGSGDPISALHSSSVRSFLPPRLALVEGATGLVATAVVP